MTEKVVVEKAVAVDRPGSRPEGGVREDNGEDGKKTLLWRRRQMQEKNALQRKWL